MTTCRSLQSALPAGKNSSVLAPIDRELLHCICLLLMLWTAPPPAVGCGSHCRRRSGPRTGNRHDRRSQAHAFLGKIRPISVGLCLRPTDLSRDQRSLRRSLREHRQWARGYRRAAEQANEIPSPHGLPPCRGPRRACGRISRYGRPWADRDLMSLSGNDRPLLQVLPNLRQQVARAVRLRHVVITSRCSRYIFLPIQRM